MNLGQPSGAGTAYTNATNYYAIGMGLRLPNRTSAVTGTSAAATTKYANYTPQLFISPPFDVPLSKFFFPSFYTLENGTLPVETDIVQPFTLDMVTIQFGSTVLTASLSNAGLVDPAGVVGVVASFNQTIPANTVYRFGVGLTKALGASFTSSQATNVLTVTAVSSGTLAVGQVLPTTGTPTITSQLSGTPGGIGTYQLDSSATVASAATTSQWPLPAQYEALTSQGFEARGHATTNFNTQLAAGTALTGNAGSVSNSLGGFLIAPTYGTGTGFDGRPAFMIDGASIDFSKGINTAAGVNMVMSLTERALFNTTGSQRFPWINMAIAASNIQQGMGDASASAKRRALIALNPNVPFTHIVMGNGLNGLGAGTGTPATFEAGQAAAIVSMKAAYPGVKVAVTPMTPKSPSTDGFQTAANQAPQLINSYDPTFPATSTGAQWTINRDYPLTLLGGAADYFIDTTPPVSFDTGTNRDKWAPASFTGTVAAGGYASGAVINVDCTVAPIVGEALCVFTTVGAGSSGKIRNVQSWTGSVPGTLAITTVAGSSSTGVSGGWFSPAAAGSLVVGSLTSDGTMGGLHPSQVAINRILAYAGAYNWNSVKNVIWP